MEENLSSECVYFSRTGLTGQLDRPDRSPFLYSETVIIGTSISFVDLGLVMSATLCYESFKFI